MKKLFLQIALILLCFLIIQNVKSQYKQTFNPAPIFEGSTVIEQVYSPGLEGNLLGDPATQPVRVFLPPGYDLYPNNRYPVVYLLHGYVSDYEQYFDLGLFDLLEDMIIDKTIPPMIVVTPNGKNAYDGCMYANSYVSGNWEDYIVQDVRQHVENNYNTLNQSVSRGIAGFSMGGYGSMLIGMKHPSVYGSIALICAATLNLEVAVAQGGIQKAEYISAAYATQYASGLPWKERYIFAEAISFTPDSTVPSFCRLPYDKDGNRIDTTWQEWIVHTPTGMLPTYKDSLLKLDNIQIYNGENDPLVFEENESFHQILLNEGIEHEYEVFDGDHHPDPVLDEMLMFFSNNLAGIVPTIRSNQYSLTKWDTLVITSDMDGSLYVVPKNNYTSIDSIVEYQILKVDASADEETDIILSGFDPGIYLVYAISNDSIVSNIPEEFSILATDIAKYRISDIKIFPNPTTKILNIEIPISMPYFVEISSLNGQLILTREIEGTTHQLDLSSFQKGVYFITIRSKDFVTTRRIIKL